PKEASIKSPLEMRTGLDSYKLEQNNLFPKPHAHPGPTPAPICPISSAAQACERCCLFFAPPSYMWRYEQDTALDPGEDVALLSVSFEDAEATQVFPKLYLSPSIEQ
ncbi:hypothetical protein KUCAC02_026381, partial [Chaenocephalus aceratus]